MLNNKGLTLFEVLLVLTILSIIISFSFYFLNSSRQSNFIFDETLENISRFIEIAREKSLLGEDNSSWGIVFINSSSKNFIQIFKDNPSSSYFIYDLPNFIIYLDPPPNTSKVLFFEKFSGKTTSTSVLLKNSNTNFQKYICIPTSSPSFISTSSSCFQF